jgi:ArsR family transcriptional regulator
MAKTRLTPQTLELVADRFKVLAEPARLELLNHLRSGEMTVSDLVDESGLAQANVSKHLRLLHSAGFVKRRKDGLFVYYALADRGVFQLCDIMCERLDAESKARRRLLAS